MGDRDDGGARTGFSRRHVLTAGAHLIAVGMLPGVAQALTPAGEVARVRGLAEAEANGLKRALAVKAPVYEGELVMTGDDARLALMLGPNSMLRLGAQTRVRIDRYLVDAGGEFDLQSGAIEFEREKGAPKSDLNFRSAYGLIAVRGTKFFAGPSKGVFGVFVDHGRVDVVAGGKVVSVGPGLGTDVAAPGDAATPAAKWKPARVKAALASVR